MSTVLTGSGKVVLHMDLVWPLMQVALHHCVVSWASHTFSLFPKERKLYSWLTRLHYREVAYSAMKVLLIQDREQCLKVALQLIWENPKPFRVAGCVWVGRKNINAQNLLSSNAGFYFSSTFPAADLLSTCYRYAMYMVAIHSYTIW